MSTFMLKLRITAIDKDEALNNVIGALNSVNSDWVNRHCRVHSIEEVDRLHYSQVVKAGSIKTPKKLRDKEAMALNDLKEELGDEMIEDDGGSVLDKKDDVLC